MKSNIARQYFQSFYTKNRVRFIAAVMLRIACIPGMLLFAWMLGAVIDTIATEQFSELWRLLWIVVLLLVGHTFVELLCDRMQSAFIHHAVANYKAQAFRLLSGKSISDFSQLNTGSYVSVLTNDVNTIEENYLNRLFDLLSQPLTFFATLVMMLHYSPLLTMVSAGLCMLPFVGEMLLSPELSRREQIVSDGNINFVSKLTDLLAGFSVIKSFKAEDATRSVFDKANGSLEMVKRSRRWWQMLLGTLSGILGICVQIGVFFFGAIFAMKGSVTTGTVIVFVNLCSSLVSPVQLIPQFLATRRAAKSLIVKLAKITAQGSTRGGDAISSTLSEAIQMKHVSFGYSQDKLVLEDLSLRLEAGKKYALVGTSGSGKSTLINLLMGTYADYEGSITVDGKELHSILPDSLYDLIGCIGQSVFVFDDSIRNNVTMFRDFPSVQVSYVLKQSGLAAIVEARGEDYHCGENGKNLSGGERQRISIARCLMRNTSVLFLDEATASLDNQTTFEIMDAILKLDGLTRLVVTHTLSKTLLQRYDEILVLRGGRIVEHGSFDTLMEQKEYFYSLYTVTNG